MALVKFFVNGVFVYKEVIGVNLFGLFVVLCFELEGKCFCLKDLFKKKYCYIIG